MNVPALSKRITNFGFKLLENEFALNARSHIVKKLASNNCSIIWARDDPSASLIIDYPSRIADYFALLGRNEYSYLMIDGGILQISYTFKHNVINGHRLLYYPCPIIFDNSLLAEFEGGLIEFIRDAYFHDLEYNAALRTPIRFDYAPDAAADGHPASHVTLNSQTCRIPVRSPLRFDQFLKFILEHFYVDALKVDGIAKLLNDQSDDECLSSKDRSRIHLTWRTS